MRGEVVALPPEDYERWLAGERRAGAGSPARRASSRPSPARSRRREIDLARMGERVAAEHGCLRCHTLDGTRTSARPGPASTARGSRSTGGGEAIADEAYLTESMMDPRAKIHPGFDT